LWNRVSVNHSNSDACVAEIVRSHLRQHMLTRIACLTNRPPTSSLREHVVPSLNYIRFVAGSRLQQVQYHYLAVLHRYRHVSYDVFTTDIEVALTGRQFGLLLLNLETPVEASSLLEFVCTHKCTINPRYPFLLRLSISTGSMPNVPAAASNFVSLAQAEAVMEFA
jgi:hypothetical protein